MNDMYRYVDDSYLERRFGPNYRLKLDGAFADMNLCLMFDELHKRDVRRWFIMQFCGVFLLTFVIVYAIVGLFGLLLSIL